MSEQKGEVTCLKLYSKPGTEKGKEPKSPEFQPSASKGSDQASMGII